ncbi:MAG: hypothetical protein HYX93_01245 [Chloroflexi bacterium]|nr:hypothetical protein [Chloroflexota bacterium]
MGLIVTPAYRVVAKFAREARDLPFEEGINHLERNLRAYVHHQLSSVQATLPELGERAAVAQLGDPEVKPLLAALESLEESGPKEIVEQALTRCTAVLPRPDLNVKVLLLPGDGESRVMVQQMKGVVGISFGSQAMVLFLWPADGWKEWLPYTVAHEYTHLVRNHLFPRGMAGGRLVYLKTQEPETLLDAMVAEGIGDAFANRLYPHLRPPWTREINPLTMARVWPRVRRRLDVSDPAEIRRILFGDGDRIPQWTGYTIGYQAVGRYLSSHPSATPATLAGLPARTIFRESGYATLAE